MLANTARSRPKKDPGKLRDVVDTVRCRTRRRLTFVVATEYAVQSFASIESAFAGLSLL